MKITKTIAKKRDKNITTRYNRRYKLMLNSLCKLIVKEVITRVGTAKAARLALIARANSSLLIWIQSRVSVYEVLVQIKKSRLCKRS